MTRHGWVLAFAAALAGCGAGDYRGGFVGNWAGNQTFSVGNTDYIISASFTVTEAGSRGLTLVGLDACHLTATAFDPGNFDLDPGQACSFILPKTPKGNCTFNNVIAASSGQRSGRSLVLSSTGSTSYTCDDGTNTSDIFTDNVTANR